MEPRDYATISSACIALLALLVNGRELLRPARLEKRAERLLNIASKLDDDDALRASLQARAREATVESGYRLKLRIRIAWAFIATGNLSLASSAVVATVKASTGDSNFIWLIPVLVVVLAGVNLDVWRTARRSRSYFRHNIYAVSDEEQVVESEQVD